jgi:hypothetical protein
MSGVKCGLGRAHENSLSTGAAAGQMSLALVDLTPGLTVGESLLISDADGTSPEWLGRVTSVAASVVAFTRPLRQTRGPGSAVWTPEDWFESGARLAPGMTTQLTPGVATERTLDGQFHTVEVEPARTQWRLELFGMAPTAATGLATWLRQATGLGLKAFTLIEPDGALSALRLTGETLERVDEPVGRCRMRLRAWVVEEGGYR